jgi:hypothetical protein
VAENPRIEELRRRVQADPASIAFAALAEEYRRIGRYDEAIETCRVGLQRHPAYLSARVTLGRALIELGDYDAAREELETVLPPRPKTSRDPRPRADPRAPRPRRRAAPEPRRAGQRPMPVAPAPCRRVGRPSRNPAGCRRKTRSRSAVVATPAPAVGARSRCGRTSAAVRSKNRASRTCGRGTATRFIPRGAAQRTDPRDLVPRGAGGHSRRGHAAARPDEETSS